MSRYSEIEVGCGISDGEEPYEAGLTSATKASSCIKVHHPSFVFVCASESYQLTEVLRGVHAVFSGVPVIGTTTAGEICNGSHERSVVVSAVASPHISARCAVGRNVSVDWKSAIDEATRDPHVASYFDPTSEVWRRLTREGKSVFAMLIVPGNTRHNDSKSYEILEVIKTKSQGRFPIVGGAAADDWRMNRNYVLLGREAFEDSLVLAVFETRLQFGIAMAHGFRPTLQTAAVTSSHDHIIETINGLPAADELPKLLGSSRRALRGKHLALTTGRTIGIPNAMGQYSVIVGTYLNDEGGCRIAQPVTPGTILTVMDPDSDGMLNAGSDAIRKAMLRAGINKPALTFVNYCALRQRIMGRESSDKEIAGMRELVGAAPLVGFYSFGEGGVSDDGVSRYNNASVSVLVLGTDLSPAALAALEAEKLRRDLELKTLELEVRVAERTRELLDKTEALTTEIEERRRFFETSLDLILVTDRQGNVIRVSPSSSSIIGYAPEEMIGHNAVKFIHQDDLESTRTEMRLARQGQSARYFETRYQHKDGRIVALAWTGVWSEPGQQHFFIGRDMTEKKRMEETERHVKETLSAVVDASPVAIICVANDRTVLVWSRAAEQIFGYSAEEAIGQRYKLVPRGQEAEFEALFQRAFSGETIRDVQVQRQRKDGSLVEVSFDAAMYDADGIRGVAFAATDITERKKAEEALKYLAHYDQLTGLRNRAALQTELKEMIACGEESSHHTAIAIFDLDGFKDTNDTLGHSVGDRLLKEVAGRLTSVAPKIARVYRLGGDEFVAVFPESGDPRVVTKIVTLMLEQLAKCFEINGELIYIGASAGIAIAPADGSNVDDLIANADLALYEAKASGGNNYRLFLPVLRARAYARRELESELRRAFSQDEFELYFQPQVALVDGAIVGAEALIRWRHPERGLLAPAAFIVALAESPVAAEVGRWVLRTACSKAAAWRAKGLPLRVGVNLFPAQFHSGTLPTDVELALMVTGLPASDLELEITENIALGHDEMMLAPLTELRNRGVGLAFDDFGTGYASLSYLRRYPLSRIKIDQTFVRKITESQEDAAIVRSVITMAHNLALKVVAEGVETAAQAEFLRAEACDEAQGYLYSRPLSEFDFEECLRSSRSDRAANPTDQSKSKDRMRG
jgi:diguanylate cyclase (GGDEF)-like protein/PAS domain S-box-containing protein